MFYEVFMNYKYYEGFIRSGIDCSSYLALRYCDDEALGD